MTGPTLGGSAVAASILVNPMPEPTLGRQDLAPCPLGINGNLSFTTRQGGTPRARRAAVLLSDTCRLLAMKWADLKSHVIREPASARARREALMEVHANSRRIGNLLGSLTAKVDLVGAGIAEKDLDRMVRALIELNVPPTGDLYSLKGARYCLDTYLDELNESDFDALRDVVLLDGPCRTYILDSISIRPDDPLRARASRVLENIAQALSKQMVRRAVHGPMLQVIDLLNARPVNGDELHAQLLPLSSFRTMLKEYLRTLSTGEFAALASALRSDNLNAALQALAQVNDPWQAESVLTLNLACIELGLEFFLTRAPRNLVFGYGNLNSALGTGNRLAVADALRYLSAAVEDACRIYSVLPDPMNMNMRRQVRESMDLFRDQRNNPHGPLNGHSLGGLDDSIRAKLGDAARGLRNFGLELEPQAY
ncbi:hypothetical protein [Alcaligenes sp. WGS1538]|uniref:hypothetical protein n=1 Tax=Alcaligenes sp. WGS1538 TaxID=3366811 RepID=UPI00372D09D8